MQLTPREERMGTEIIVMATVAAALFLVTAVWADLYASNSSR
jgi:hypothetical protein